MLILGALALTIIALIFFAVISSGLSKHNDWE